jgi:calcineurin-like phosphoesterase
MTGPMDSVIGVKKEAAISKFVTQIPQYFEVAAGPFQFNGALIEI